MSSSGKWGILFLIFCISATACATKTGLEPGPGAMSFGLGKNEIVDNLAGVELVANANAWKGTPEIIQQVIPIQVVVRNKHGKTVRVQDRYFSLVTDTGKTYAAQSPDQIKGEVRVASPGFYTGPSFYYHSFAAPPVFGYYPGVPGVVEPFYYDPFFYSRYDNYYRKSLCPRRTWPLMHFLRSIFQTAVRYPASCISTKSRMQVRRI